MKNNMDSIKEFAQNLVRIPSQGGIDDCRKIVDCAYDFGTALGLPFVKILDDNSDPVALVCDIKGKYPGKAWCLNACIDTAPVGNLSAWKDDPFSGVIKEGQLEGRGAADSKMAVSIFIHLAHELLQLKDSMHGDLVLIFDADEHTGNFGGIKAAIQKGYKPDGVMIGYSGGRELVVGSRGFSRYEITLNGLGGHSGSSAPVKDNALVRLFDMGQELTLNQPQSVPVDSFTKPPRVTVTQAQAGDGFSVIPSKATLRVDVRLTPQFNEAAADAHIRRIVNAHDLSHHVPAERETKIEKVASEPAYVTPVTSELRMAMSGAIKEVCGKDVPEIICGPSNIGCYLAKQGIEVTAGYGVPAKAIHAPNEKANLGTVRAVYQVYRKACKTLLRI